MADDINAKAESFDEDARTALVCEDNAGFRDNMTSVLKELKYATEIAAGTEDAFEKIRFNRYDVIIISEKFAGSAPDANEVLKHLQKMPMSNRRHIFVALLGQNLVTQDNMMSFDKSVNVVINEKDMPNLKGILKKSIADNDQFYKVYKESRVKLGKI